MFIKLGYILVFLVAFITNACNQLKQVVIGNDVFSEVATIRINKFDFDKKLVKNTQDENSGFKKKYKSKCTESTATSIPERRINHRCIRTEYPVLFIEHSGTFTYYLHCPERGPPAFQ